MGSTSDSDTIVLFTTGGTMDKVYFDQPGDYAVGPPMIRDILANGRVESGIEIRELLRKDSQEMNDHDRQAIRHAVATCGADRIVITHGTDTMPLTAAALEGLIGKTIVLTGAFVPARFSNSDTPFNVGMAVAAARTLAPGVYIAMNGSVVPGTSVRKDRERLRFVPV